jgi:hypothetical protein
MRTSDCRLALYKTGSFLSSFGCLISENKGNLQKLKNTPKSLRSRAQQSHVKITIALVPHSIRQPIERKLKSKYGEGEVGLPAHRVEAPPRPSSQAIHH